MVALFTLLASVLLAVPALAAPARLPGAGQAPKYPLPRASTKTLKTSVGTAAGVLDGSAYRYVVRYASAARWAQSKIATTWTLPNNLTDPSGSPLMCPQAGVDPSTYSEDCLSMIFYVPATITATSKVPTLVWIHGGSSISGSATAPGLDGSKLAVATNSIVAVIQYRLGGLGWLAPNGAQNLAVQDVVTALKFVNNVVPSFGGVAGKVTLDGQSSGGTIIRSLLAAPSASSLFQSAIMQSDPMDYGFFTPAIQSDLNSYFVSQLGCAATDSACLAGLSAADIITAANATTWNAGDVNAAASGGENLRPVQDGALITTPLDSTAPFPPQTKPIMLTTAAMDAAYTIYYNFDAPLPGSYYEPVIEASYSDASTTTIVNSAYYKLPNTLANDPNGDIRPNLEVLGTDGIWRCPAYTFAREWAAAGAKVYVGEYVVGSSYPGNEEVPACTIPGVVCHQDDIMIVFGTAPSPNSAQSALIAEVQARYAAFLATGNPNVARYPNWAAAGAQTVNGYFLGNGGGSVPAGGCQTNLWGTSALPYDYQVYGI